MAQVKMTEEELQEIKDRKARENPKGEIMYDEPIGPQREDPHEHDDPHQYSSDPGPQRPSAENPHTDAHQYSEPIGPVQSPVRKHLTAGANNFLFAVAPMAHVVNGVHALNNGNALLGRNTGRSPVSAPPAIMPYAQRGGFSPFISPYAARPAPRQTKTQRREDRRQQRTSTGVPGWVMGVGPAPWTNQKTTTTKKKKKQPRQTQARMPSWIMPGKPSWLRF
jgi:hypothetical protein